MTDPVNPAEPAPSAASTAGLPAGADSAADPTMAVRIGTAERDDAIHALDVHMEAGRIDAEEYGERTARVYAARTWGDITPLFADLPDPRPGPPKPARRSPATLVPTSTTPVTRYEARAARVARRDERKTKHPIATAAVALSPFVALALFAIVHTWVWFLLIPATAIVAGIRWANDD